MKGYAFAAPIVSGKLDAWKEFCYEINGRRRAERQESMRRCGITRELIFLQRTPNADFAVLYVEGQEPERQFSILLGSDHPFDRWLCEQIVDAHGIDLGAPPPPTNELVADVSAT